MLDVRVGSEADVDARELRSPLWARTRHRIYDSTPDFAREASVKCVVTVITATDC